MTFLRLGKNHEQAQIKRFSKGQLILQSDDAAAYLYLIRKGVVKLFDITPDGTENVIGILGVDEFFPIDKIFGQKRQGDAYYQAFTDCEVRLVPQEDFLRDLAKDQKMLSSLVDYFVERDLDYQLRIKGLEQIRAKHKLAYALGFVVRKFGKPLKRNSTKMYTVDIPFTQQDFASLVGLTRETTNVQLRELEKLGILRYHRRRYIVYVDKLHDFVSEELVPKPTRTTDTQTGKIG